jgi:ankyrin repeat protein
MRLMRHFPICVGIVLALVFVMNTSSVAGNSPELLTAIRSGDHARVQKLLTGGADVNTTDSEGTTALMHAVIESDMRMMKLLMDRGANVNTKNSSDSTALMYAAPNLDKTRLLLGAGADAKAKNKRGATPMSVAAMSANSAPVLKLLASKGGQAEDRLIPLAAAKGDLEAIQFLLSSGAAPGDLSGGAVSAAIQTRCEACAKLLVEKGAGVNGLRANGTGVLNDSVRRGMTDLSQYLLDHGASLESKDRENFTLLMQAVLSMEPPPARDRTIEWLLSKKVDPNAKNDRGDTAYQLAARLGISSTVDLLAKWGANGTKEEWPKPAGGAGSAEEAVRKILPLLEISGEPGFKSRSCVSCHSNSLPAMTVALARQKGFKVNEEQAKKELGFAVATDMPYLEQMRVGSTIGGASNTLGYTLMGMAAAGYPSDALTDAHIHYLSIHQSADGAWRNPAYRPPEEYSPFTTTAVVLRAIKLYPIPGRREEFETRLARAKRWLLSGKPYSTEERSMQLNGLSDAGASAAERAPFVKALKATQNADGSWTQLPGMPAEAYATGEALYALHISGDVPVKDVAYQRGIDWLLKNQLADGTWFVPALAVPVQPHTFESFPHGWHQFASEAGSSWATLALLFTLPDKRP